MADTDPSTVKVKIDNHYEDGHKFSTLIDAPVPVYVTDLDDEVWWEEHVWPQTGGRPGPDASLDACYFAEVIASADPNHIGYKWEWC